MNRVIVAVLISILTGFIGGCAQQKLSADKYKIDPNEIHENHLKTAKKVYISPIIDRLNKNNRKFIDPKFSTTAYLTDALKQELIAAGITPVTAPFSVGPSLESAQETIASQANKQESAVYFVGEVCWFNHDKLTLDAKLYSPSGKTLFKKRGLCDMVNVGATTQKITYMTLRQIIADPVFQKAIQ